jgi:hypothetical protein
MCFSKNIHNLLVQLHAVVLTGNILFHIKKSINLFGGGGRLWCLTSLSTIFQLYRVHD